MARKQSALAAAIAKEETTPPTAEMFPVQPAAPVARPAVPAPANVPSHRANKKARTHWLTPAYWDTLDEMAFRLKTSREALVAEALNDLFAKRNFPLVREQ